MITQGSGIPEQLVSEAAQARADVVVVGLATPAADMLTAIRELIQLRPVARVLVIVDVRPGLDLAEIARSGVMSVVSRTATPQEALDAVRQTLAGKQRVAGDIAATLMEELAVTSGRSQAKNLPNGLTHRELEVLQLVGDGLPNRDVARKLHISENTVKNHMRSIHEKLGVKTRTEAVVTAAREGLFGIT